MDHKPSAVDVYPVIFYDVKQIFGILPFDGITMHSRSQDTFFQKADAFGVPRRFRFIKPDNDEYNNR
jgi:hypothetical protein